MTTTDHIPSRGCYQRGCRLAGCVRESYLYEKRLALDHARGHRRNIDATQIRVHAERLVASNWTHRQIAGAANVARSVIGDLLTGRPEVRSSTALAVLSIPIGPPPVLAIGVNAAGSMRRIQALVFIGHNCQTIAAHATSSDDKIARIAAGQFTTVSADTAADIADAYRALIATPGTSTRARQHARNKKWHGPLAWDDIDNPECKPETEHRKSRAKASTKPKVYADPARVAQLTAAGKSAAQIALEIGCHQRTVVRARGRAEQMAVAA